MTLRIPLWLALSGCLGSAAVGIVAAQAPEKPEKPAQPGAAKPPELPSLTEYPYLPNRYGEVYFPSVAEWRALQVTALGASTTRLTSEFSRQHLTCFATNKGLALTLDLLPQPTWKHYLPGGKFSAPVETVKPDLEKAVKATVGFVRNFFSEVRDQDISLRVFIQSEYVGVWEKGKFTLKVELPAQ